MTPDPMRSQPPARAQPPLWASSLLVGTAAVRAFARGYPALGAALAALTATSVVHHSSYNSAADFARLAGGVRQRADHAAVALTAALVGYHLVRSVTRPTHQAATTAALVAVAALYVSESPAALTGSGSCTPDEWHDACTTHLHMHCAGTFALHCLLGGMH